MTTHLDPGPASLPELEARLARDLAVLNQPAPNWITPTPGALDVAVIGAGMAGLVTAFALIREGVRNLRLFDANPAGFEGPWRTYARMDTLRSPKHLTGPCLGMPSLTFRAWYEAQFGAGAWETLWRIPTGQWMDYLVWFRQALDLPVTNGAEMTGMRPHGATIALDFADGQTIQARRVVLANGRDGLGGPARPALFDALPDSVCRHTADAIDFPAWRGKRVAVVGAGSSAFDNAAKALEAGAASVTMLMRRADVPRINKGMGVSSPGMNLGFYDLPIADRLRLNRYLDSSGSPPPRLSVMRCSRHPNFHWLRATGVTAAQMEGDQAVLTTSRGKMAFDLVIIGTGFAIDTSKRPEIAALTACMQRWADVSEEAAADGGDYAASPFLGPYFEFLPKRPEDGWISRVYCQNFAANLSHYKLTGDIPAISAGAERVADGVMRSFFTEDFEDHYNRLVAYETPELQGDEWVPEPLPDISA